jgi:hypothetical protein
LKIYLPRYRDGLHTISVAPAAIDATARVPEWQDAEGNPTSQTVTFRYSEAVVEDPLGRFLVAHGYAKKTRPSLYA